jgi:hypothetical protein
MTFQPLQLVRALAGAKVWRGVQPLGANEVASATLADGVASTDNQKLVSIQASDGTR